MNEPNRSVQITMHSTRLRMSLLLIAGLLATACAVFEARAQFQELQSRVTEFTLSNGMKFIALDRPQAPVASFFTYADVGAAQETKGITGLAHIFEHMAFKGTSRIGTKDYDAEKQALEAVDRAYETLSRERQKGHLSDLDKIRQLEQDFRTAQAEAGKLVQANELDEIIERAGGRGLNASTGTDYTVYFFSLPSNAAELWFYLESERFRDPVLREFYRERDVVMEERRMRAESNPIGKMVEEFLCIAYKAHPYGEPVIGHMSDLQNITRADAEVFFKQYYGPANLISAAVGDVNPERVRQLAETYFGRIPSEPKPEPLRTAEPPQVGERRVTLRLAAQRFIVIGYHKPDINHPDHAIYEAISSLLSEGRSSRMYRSLVRDKKVAVEAAGFPGFPGQKYPGLFVFYAVTAPGHTNGEAEQAIDEEISRLKSELVSNDELSGIKRRARANLIRQLDSNTGLARALATYQGLTGDWRNLFKQLDKINAVTPEGIQRVTRETFTLDNRTVAVIEPSQMTATK